ncbi:hypothetical protein [Leptolyngbya sp. 7M]|uniref:Uncharacterized protein n=1 Tax=Leptolyngbya sp. NK1-12 TaxID=2547451 RepID=A0AA96WIA2_9CYAN|nr:hypothetical protein [Leptolyngbya sp. 7M]QYO63622.1 hypothetical protein JVX88_27690 [Leptolyngbya sp. 7M]WNZ25639.1 hypothetical protein HJG54_24235 [Leptolyngbya sp. NK1-12]
MPKRKPQVRIYVSEDVDKLLKIIAAVKEISVNALMNEAIEDYLNKPEIQQIIDKHRLDELD